MTWKACDGCHGVVRRFIDRACSECGYTERAPEPVVCAETIDMFGAPAMAPPTPPSNGIATSDAAAASLTPERLNECQRLIVAALDRRRDQGATRGEMVALTKLSGSTIRPRVLELADGGWVCARREDGTEIPLPGRDEDAGEIRRETSGGRKATVVYLRRARMALIDQRRAERAGEEIAA